MAKSGQIYIRFIGLNETDGNAGREKIIDFLESVLESEVDRENVVVTFPEPRKSALLEFKSDTISYGEAKTIYDACFGKDYCGHKLAVEAFNSMNHSIIKPN